MRALAHRSGEAGKQIKWLIGTSVERVGQGSALVDEAGATMREVVNSIRKPGDLVGEMTIAGSDQSTDVGQIGDAVAQLDQATQQNAAAPWRRTRRSPRA